VKGGEIEAKKAWRGSYVEELPAATRILPSGSHSRRIAPSAAIASSSSADPMLAPVSVSFIGIFDVKFRIRRN
jgi:hypothetical protein